MLHSIQAIIRLILLARCINPHKSSWQCFVESLESERVFLRKKTGGDILWCDLRLFACRFHLLIPVSAWKDARHTYHVTFPLRSLGKCLLESKPVHRVLLAVIDRNRDQQGQPHIDPDQKDHQEDPGLAFNHRSDSCPHLLFPLLHLLSPSLRASSRRGTSR